MNDRRISSLRGKVLVRDEVDPRSFVLQSPVGSEATCVPPHSEDWSASKSCESLRVVVSSHNAVTPLPRVIEATIEAEHYGMIRRVHPQENPGLAKGLCHDVRFQQSEPVVRCKSASSASYADVGSPPLHEVPDGVKPAPTYPAASRRILPR